MLTVLTAAATDARDLLAPAAALAELALDDSATALLAGYIRQATAQIAAACGRDTFARETVAETFRLDGCRDRLILTRRPVVSVAAITAGTETLAEGGWELDGRFLCRLSAGGERIGWRSGKVTVAYTAGYDLPAGAPADLAAEAMALIKAAWFGRDRDPALRSQAFDGIGTDTFGFGSRPEDLAQRLACYRWE